MVVALVFSEAKGIFHPYYVSLLAPFAAALSGAGVAQLRAGGRPARVMAPLAVVAGVTCEVAVLHEYPGQLRWLVPVLIVVGAGAAVVLIAFEDRALRTVALSCGVAALLIGPGIWAVDTLGYATSGTFPAGGPQSALSAGGGGGPGGGGGGFGARPSGTGGGIGGVRLFGAGGGSGNGSGGGSNTGPPQPPGGGTVGLPAGAGGAGAGPMPGAGGPPGGFSGGGAGQGPGGGAIGAPLGNSRTIAQALAYAKQHGGGTVAVSSQSSAASEIVSHDADVAGIGGFSGRESDVSVAWLAGEIGRGQIRWVLAESSQASGPRLAGDTREGSRKAIAAVTKACVKVTLPASATGGESEAAGGRGGGESTLYDCSGRAAALLGTQQSRA